MLKSKRLTVFSIVILGQFPVARDSNQCALVLFTSMVAVAIVLLINLRQLAL